MYNICCDFVYKLMKIDDDDGVIKVRPTPTQTTSCLSFFIRDSLVSEILVRESE